MWRAAAYLCLLLAASADSRRLDDYIRHFEELNYDRQTLGTRHDRVKRSTNDKNLHLEFTAFGRHFQLHLQPDTEGFTPDAVIEVDGKSEPLDTSHIYRGELYGDPSSPVHGSVIQGRFLGTIKHSDSGSYWVEAAEKYFQKPSFHSVIYKEEDVEDRKFFDDLRKRREATSSKGGCGNSDPRVSEWMRTVQNSTVPASEGVRDPNLEESSGADEHGAFKYTRRGQEVHGGKRAPRQAAGNQKTCTLFLQSDPELWRYYNETFYSKAATADQVKQQISALFSSHVSEVNGIYTTTTFKDTTGTSPKLYGGYNFRVDRILINTTEPCDDNIASNDSPYCNRAIDASNLLNLNSYRNHDGYCLAFIFTYRDFSGGTLGLAWVADPGRTVGGVCSKYTLITSDTIQSPLSLNTGIVSLLNYGRTVPSAVSVITFAHEIGHTFGSPHDNPDTNPDCAPLSASKSSQGNYIMFASATSGDMPNNNRFSSCSMQKIGAVLTSVTQGLNGHYNCFQGPRAKTSLKRVKALNTTTSQCAFADASWVLQSPSEKFPRLKYSDSHAYTAHYDSRKHAVMVILDTPISHEVSALFGLKCLLEYASYNGLLEVPAQKEFRFHPMAEKSHVNVLYACRCPADAPAGLPSSVGLWEGAAPRCVATVVLPVLSSGFSEEPRQRALEALDTKVKFAVCTSPFSRSFSSAVALAEFVEINSMFGAERFVFYNYSSAGRELWRLLDAYVQEGMAAVVPWPLYDGGEEKMSYFAQMAAFQDCLYRNLQTATYLVVLDVDEFIVPRASSGPPQSWGGIAVRSRCNVAERPSSIGSWQFRNTFFKLEWPDGKLYGAAGGRQGRAARRYRMQTLLKTWREKLVWPLNERSKYFVLAQRADYLLVHTPELVDGYEQCAVPVEEALLQHYRDWGDPYVEADMLSKGVEDTFLAEQHGAEIERRVGERLRAAGLVT